MITSPVVHPRRPGEALGHSPTSNPSIAYVMYTRHCKHLEKTELVDLQVDDNINCYWKYIVG